MRPGLQHTQKGNDEHGRHARQHVQDRPRCSLGILQCAVPRRPFRTCSCASLASTLLSTRIPVFRGMRDGGEGVMVVEEVGEAEQVDEQAGGSASAVISCRQSAQPPQASARARLGGCWLSGR